MPFEERSTDNEFRIVRLTPEQVGRLWDYLMPRLAQAIPSPTMTTQGTMNEVLRQLMAGRMTLYVMKRGSEYLGAGITFNGSDSITKLRTLFLYALYAEKDISSEEWLEFFQLLNRIAHREGCRTITAQSDVEHIINLAQSLGGDTGTRLITFKVTDNGRK